MLFKINGQKLKKIRGQRSLGQISREAKGAFSDVALLHWEKEDRQPREKSVKALLAVYGCDLEDIAEPMALN